MADKKNKRVIIVGAGEGGRVALNCLKYRKDLEFAGFLDDCLLAKKNNGVLGKVVDYKKFKDCLFHVAIGNNLFRQKIFDFLKKNNCNFISLIHPRACVENDVLVGENVFIGANVYINIGSKIGDNTTIYNGCIIEHDNSIGKHCYLAPGVVTGGGVRVDNSVFIGLNSAIRDHIKIGRGSFVGMGSIIVKDLGENLLIYNRLEFVIKKNNL